VSQVVTIVKHELSRIYSIAVFYSPLCGNKTRYCRIEFFCIFSCSIADQQMFPHVRRKTRSYLSRWWRQMD